MAGNIDEWVNEWYDIAYYSSTPGTRTLLAQLLEARKLTGEEIFGHIGLNSTRGMASNPSNAFDIGFRCAYPP